MGVASLFPIHKFDNGFGGVRFDCGAFGVAINNANRLETGRFWSIETCQGAEHDNAQTTALPGEAGVIGQGSGACSARRGAGLPAAAALQHPRPDLAGRAT